MRNGLSEISGQSPLGVLRLNGRELLFGEARRVHASTKERVLSVRKVTSSCAVLRQELQRKARLPIDDKSRLHSVTRISPSFQDRMSACAYFQSARECYGLISKLHLSNAEHLDAGTQCLCPSGGRILRGFSNGYSKYLLTYSVFHAWTEVG